jgi:hypothetical protein
VLIVVSNYQSAELSRLKEMTAPHTLLLNTVNQCAMSMLLEFKINGFCGTYSMYSSTHSAV